MTSQKDKFICEKLGIVRCYWENFESEAGRVQLLKLMMKRKDWSEFYEYKLCGYNLDCEAVFELELIIDDTGKFRDAVYKWLGGEG